MSPVAQAEMVGCLPPQDSFFHCDEQVLEEYCLGLLNEQRTNVVEEHLLMCEKCQEALETQNEFVQCLKAALRAQRTPQNLPYFPKSA
jgi:anti-sigma factor RsiW